MYFEHTHTSPNSSHSHPLYSLIPSQSILRFIPFFLSPLSPICAAQLVLGVGPALVCGHLIIENGLSLSSDSGRISWPHSPLYAGNSSGWSLLKFCACCQKHCVFICATAQLCLVNSVSLMVATSSGSRSLSSPSSEKVQSLEGRGVICMSHLGLCTLQSQVLCKLTS